MKIVKNRPNVKLVKRNYKIVRLVPTAPSTNVHVHVKQQKSERRGSTVGALQIFNYFWFIHA